MALIGYEVGSSWKSVMHGFSDAGYLFAALAVLAVVLFLAHRYRSYNSARAAASAAASSEEPQVSEVNPRLRP